MGLRIVSVKGLNRYVWIIISIIIVGATTALMLKFGLDWTRDRATHWGHEHMKEMGLEGDKEDKDASR